MGIANGIPYAVSFLATMYATYLLCRYVSMIVADPDEEAVQRPTINGTRVFVSLIQNANSERALIKAAQASWLNPYDHFIFTEKEASWRDRTLIRFPASAYGDVPRIRWIAAYLTHTTDLASEWYLFVPDSSFVVVENLLQPMGGAPIDRPAFSLIEDPQNSTFHLLLLNRQALDFMAKAHSLNICSSYGRTSLSHCLQRLGGAVQIPVERDGDGKFLYHVQTRHMAANELYANTKDGHYTDLGEQFDVLSTNAHSFHNLESKEIVWFQAMIRGMRRPAQ